MSEPPLKKVKLKKHKKTQALSSEPQNTLPEIVIWINGTFKIT